MEGCVSLSWYGKLEYLFKFVYREEFPEHILEKKKKQKDVFRVSMVTYFLPTVC